MTSSTMRPQYGDTDRETRTANRLVRALSQALRVPLMVKLLGAALLIDVAVVVEPLVFPGGFALTHPVTVLLLSFVTTSVLVWLALRPVAVLEMTADKISSGDFAARVPESLLADRALTRLSATMNRLLDRVQADRARIQYLAGRVVRARDIEREAVARELRDSLAQNLAAIALQLAAIQRADLDIETSKLLEAAKSTVNELNEELRNLAESLHPGTIRELGIVNALNTLVRVAARRTGTSVRVDAERAFTPVPPDAAAALYRVAEEALRNVVQHAGAKHAVVTLTSDADGTALIVEDDGRGMDITKAEPLQSGLGLFSARAILALAGGELQFSSAPGRGARVTARIPHSTMFGRSWQATS